jgi:hypothetical protein
MGTKITKITNPKIYEAFVKIDLDSGNPPSEEYDIPDYWAEKLDEIEAALAKLSSHEFENFCCGTPEEIDAMAERSNDLGIANLFLNEYTTGWKGPRNFLNPILIRVLLFWKSRIKHMKLLKWSWKNDNKIS